MKRSYIWIVLFLVAFVSTGCHQKEARIDTVTLNLGMDPPTLSGQAATKVQALTVIRHLGEGLTRINQKGDIEPALAETISSLGEGDRYHFVLRKTAQWSPGVPVQAEDFQRSYLMMLTHAARSPMVEQLFTIKNAKLIYQGRMPASSLGMQIINEREIQFELEAPNPSFLYQLSTPLFFPIRSSYQPDTPSTASCGAFYLKSWEREKQLVLEKNPHYWDAQNVQIQRMVITTIADPHTQFEMFNSGQLDWCGAPFLDIPEEALDSLRGKVQNFKESSVHMLVFNTRKAPFSNVKIRKAFSYAIDRPNLVKQRIYSGSPASSFVPPTITQEESSSYFPLYAPQEAQNLLKEGLEEEGLKLEDLAHLQFRCFNKAPFPRRVQAIQDNWSKVLGIKTEIAPLEWQMLVQSLLAGDFHVSTASWVADFPDPINFLQLYRDLQGGCNLPGWEDGRYQHQLDTAIHSTDNNLRKSHLQQAERLLLDQMVIAPISFPQSPYLVSERLKNVYCNPIGYIDLRWASLE